MQNASAPKNRQKLGLVTKNNNKQAVNKIVHYADKGFLSALNLISPSELLLYTPRDYADFTHFVRQIHAGLAGDEHVNLAVTVSSKPQRYGDRKSAPRVDCYVTDGVKQVKLTAFGDLSGWLTLSAGDSIYVHCKVTAWNGKLFLQSAKLIDPKWVGRIMPVYKNKGSLGSDAIASAIAGGLDKLTKDTAKLIVTRLGTIPEGYLLEQADVFDFSSLNELLKAVHAPDSISQARAAMQAVRQLARFEVLQVAKQRKAYNHCPESVVSVTEDVVINAVRQLPFALTLHQQSAINDIVSDLRSPTPMCRLLSGDVGHGKSAVIQVTAMAAHAAGAKVAILTPNQLLVDQLVAEFNQFYPSLPISKVTGATKSVEVIENSIVVGTTAIISKLAKLDWKPDYLIVDEQEKFSRGQREAVSDTHTNILEATATCIPRTGALVAFGGMDVSILNMCPVEKHIKPIIVRSNYCALQ